MMMESTMRDSYEVPEQPPRPARTGPARVLLVDDDPDFLATTAEALAGEGLSVQVARTAGEAVQRAVADPPDVILLDILLGGADGIDVLEVLRAQPETRRVPIVACTALGRRDSAKLLPSVGFDGLLAKPLDARDLARALKAHARARTED
jgi:CheY-like chemotaxis protein